MHALISATNTEGLLILAKALHRCGYVITASTENVRTFRESKIPCRPVYDLTGASEGILNGLVALLHPKIFAALLADRTAAGHVGSLSKHHVEPIDIIVVDVTQPMHAGEVGNLAVVIAAAAGTGACTPVIHSSDYAAVTTDLAAGQITQDTRRRLASHALNEISIWTSHASRSIRKS